MYHLSDFVKAKIIVRWEDNHSIMSISRELGVLRNTARLWIRRYQESGDVKRNRPGRQPLAFTDASNRYREIIRLHTEEPFKTTRSTAETFNVSLDTVRKHLHGIHHYKPAKKIVLSEAHRQVRIRFASNYLNFDWENNIVIFSDEKSFKLDNDGRKILWGRPGERYNPQNVLPLRTSGRITLGHWGWMSSMGPGELVEFGERMKKEKYLEILQEVMIPIVRNVPISRGTNIFYSR